MRQDDLYLWFLANPSSPRYIGALKLVSAGKGVSLHYSHDWLTNGFALSEDLPLADIEILPPGRLTADRQRAVGAVDDARPDRWGEKVIRLVDKPKRLSLMEYLYYAGDDRFGALGVSTSPTTYTPRMGGPLPRKRMGISIATLQRLEAGDPSVSIGIMATALWLINRDSALGNLAAPEYDRGALELDVRKAEELGRARALISAEARLRKNQKEG